MKLKSKFTEQQWDILQRLFRIASFARTERIFAEQIQVLVSDYQSFRGYRDDIEYYARGIVLSGINKIKYVKGWPGPVGSFPEIDCIINPSEFDLEKRIRIMEKNREIIRLANSIVDLVEENYQPGPIDIGISDSTPDMGETGFPVLYMINPDPTEEIDKLANQIMVIASEITHVELEDATAPDDPMPPPVVIPDKPGSGSGSGGG